MMIYRSNFHILTRGVLRTKERRTARGNHAPYGDVIKWAQ
ncbi:hypothetical protein GGE09_003457 [Roseobacter sp. N2S]|nr:hypothetical protein [Roseobacter sp. N2S]